MKNMGVFVIPVILVLGILGFFTSTYSIGGGYTAVIENTMTGSMDVVYGPKFGFKMPFFTNVHEYREVSTLSFDGDEADSTRNLPPITVRFADTYSAQINSSFRFKMPRDPEKVKAIHLDFRSFTNMVDSLFTKNARNTTVVTGTQFTGEEFFQGGINEYKNALADQMENGLFVTRRVQVEIEQTGLASVGLENSDANKTEVAKQLVWKTVPVKDSKGFPLRQENPFKDYGIEVTQVTLTNPIPDTLLEQLLAEKKRLVGKRIATIQEQETARAEADTEQLKKEIERRRAVADANRQKELAVIEEQKKVEIERQAAILETTRKEKEQALAVIEKTKELEVAQANRGIQEANAEAAKFEAQALRETGLAQADVLEAKYAALGAYKEIYMSELQRDIAQVMYNNLKDFRINMPENYVVMGSDSGDSPLQSNLDLLSTYGALGSMKALEVPANSGR